MGATVFLETPMDGDSSIECEEVRLIGDVVWAIPTTENGQRIVPMSNVTGVSGEVVEQDVDEIEYPGGLITELVTRIS